jgi:hypothetical protein
MIEHTIWPWAQYEPMCGLRTFIVLILSGWLNISHRVGGRRNEWTVGYADEWVVVFMGSAVVRGGTL